jgi:pyruvate kinase
MASIVASRGLVEHLLGDESSADRKPAVSIRRGRKLLRRHTKSLFGYRSKGRRTRIMVTFPHEAATNYALVHDLISAGMNSTRINCAHDGPEVWEGMINNVRAASEALRRKVRITMDLAGPKIRTGPMATGPAVVSFQPDRDQYGRVSGPGIVWLGPPEHTGPVEDAVCLNISADFLAVLRVGDRILFRDTRNKERYLDVVEATASGFFCQAFDRAFVVSGTRFHHRTWEGHTAELTNIPATPRKIKLKVGDLLTVHRSGDLGEPARKNDHGQVVSHAHVSCTNTEIFTHVAVGHRVLFDDGKIEGVIVDRVAGEELVVRITYAKAEGQKLAGDKGMNFPDSRLTISGLTDKDREDLRFVVQHADAVNMSFVNTPADVDDLIQAIEELGGLGRIGVVLKIETRNAFANLTDILLTAMKTYPVGVMIARGDLAVECGWENMARVQYEIQSLCRAGHIPDVWATQVLEQMAKKGLPSRAELTDAAAALSAECVMLNKGPYVVSAVRMLDRIFKDMRAYEHDKAPMLPVLQPA